MNPLIFQPVFSMLFGQSAPPSSEATPATPSAPAVVPDSVPAAPPPAVEDPHSFLTQIDSLHWLVNYPQLEMLATLGVLLVFAWIVHLILRLVMVRIVKRIFLKSATWWDDVLLEHRVFHRLELLIPLILIERGMMLVPHLDASLLLFIHRLAIALIILLVVTAFGSFLTAVNVIYTRYPVSRGRPIKGYLQVVKLMAYIAAGIMMITALMGLQPWWFVSGMGAMMAVILLIFRDTLLSLVAGVQLVNNDLLRVGDWIEMPQFNADGDVVDISLNVVKVQNWDKTISVIPAHKFLENSFKNWRAMGESGGRRIKRSLYIDMATIHFLDQEQVARFSRFKLLSQYIQDKSNEIAAYNREHVPADAADVIANARHLTNVGTLRAYIFNYLRNHPKIHKDMTLIVRQLSPEATGLPIEIYTFTNDTRWDVYEGIQSDIFDHILAIVPEFGLRVYQQPAGADVQAIARQLPEKAS